MIGKCLRKVIQILLITNILHNDPKRRKKGLHYLPVKKLSTLLRGITSKHDSGFYCLNCLHSFRTENKLKSHEKVCKNKEFSGIIMSSEKDKILELNQHMKFDKMSYIIYAEWNLI